MIKKILIINGPNLNLLGEREESKYGKVTLDDLRKNCESHAKLINMKVKFDQSNIEGEIVTMIQKAKGAFDGIIINAAGYTHTSVAILDALLAVKIPTIEVHITNIYNREEFRKKSLISKAAEGIICGFGVNGYIMALDSMKNNLEKKNENK
jgi:3-dehydroquinate dehydratase II